MPEVFWRNRTPIQMGGSLTSGGLSNGTSGTADVIGSGNSFGRVSLPVLADGDLRGVNVGLDKSSTVEYAGGTLTLRNALLSIAVDHTPHSKATSYTVFIARGELRLTSKSGGASADTYRLRQTGGAAFNSGSKVLAPPPAGATLVQGTLRNGEGSITCALL